MKHVRTKDIFQIEIDKLEPYDRFSFLLEDKTFVFMEKQGGKFAVNAVADEMLSQDEICERAKDADGYVSLRGNMMDEIVHVSAMTMKKTYLRLKSAEK